MHRCCLIVALELIDLGNVERSPFGCSEHSILQEELAERTLGAAFGFLVFLLEIHLFVSRSKMLVVSARENKIQMHNETYTCKHHRFVRMKCT